MPHGNSNIDEEFAVLMNPAGIDGFRDLVSDGRERNGILFWGFVDRMKHSVRATAALRTSRRCRLLGPKPRYIRVIMREQNRISKITRRRE